MFFLVNAYLLESFHKKILILAGLALKLKLEQTIFFLCLYLFKFTLLKYLETNILELASALKYLGATWFLGKVNFMPRLNEK